MGDSADAVIRRERVIIMGMIKFNEEIFIEILSKMRTIRSNLDEQITDIDQIWTSVKSDTEIFDRRISHLIKNMIDEYKEIDRLILQGKQICRTYKDKEREIQDMVDDLPEHLDNNRTKMPDGTELIFQRMSWADEQRMRQIIGPIGDEDSVMPKHFTVKMRHEAWLYKLADDQKNIWNNEILPKKTDQFVPLIKYEQFFEMKK